MALASRLKKAGIKRKPKRKSPVWKGPEEDGITFSLLSRYLVCKERFRLLVVEGLRPVSTFNHRMEYGQMWHVCEAWWANGKDWKPWLQAYCLNLCKKYPLQQEQINHWYQVCQVAFPIYVGYWAKHPDAKKRTPLLQEQVFNVPYRLPSGRMVRLRGKWDSVDLIGPKRDHGIYNQENKTKADINEQQMQRQLQFDLQTMLYLVALVLHIQEHGPLSKAADGVPIRGVLYNVVRRPLSGGKGSIRRHQATKTKPEETLKHFYNRLSDIIKEDPGHFFMRWKVEVTSQDIERFKREFLDPKLEELCDWWEKMQVNKDPFDYSYLRAGWHYRTPYGFYNVLAESGSAELDEYLATGSKVGLESTDRLFRELE